MFVQLWWSRTVSWCAAVWIKELWDPDPRTTSSTSYCETGVSRRRRMPCHVWPVWLPFTSVSLQCVFLCVSGSSHDGRDVFMISVLKQIEASLSVSETWRPDRDSWRPNRNYWTMDIRNVMNISKPWRPADYSSSQAAPLRKRSRWERENESVWCYTDAHTHTLELCFSADDLCVMNMCVSRR